MKRRVWSLGLLCLFLPPLAPGEDLDAVRTEADSQDRELFGSHAAARASTAYHLDQAQIARLAGPGGANGEAALAFLPGVSYNAPDALGLANIQSPNKGLRVRGETAQHGAGDLLEGVPLIAGVPGPGQWLVDQGDIRGETLYAGAVPPSLLAPGSLAGVVDSRLRWPTGKQGVSLEQSVGSKGFTRSFLCYDSPRLPGDSTLFLSGSFTRAGLWRGWGASPQGRTNVALGWQQPYADGVVRLFYVHDDYRADNYQPLTFAQSQDLDRFARLAYAADPSSNPALPQAAFYQGYNHQHFQDDALLLSWQQSLQDWGSLTLVPYGLRETGEYWRGIVMAGQPLVQRSAIDTWRWGVQLRWRKDLQNWHWSAGYAFDAKNPPHPLLNSALFAPTAAGGLRFLRWSQLGKGASPERVHTLYGEGEWRAGPWSLSAGGRYLWDTLPGITSFAPASTQATALSAALSTATPVPALSVRGPTLRAFLPYAAAQVLLAPDWLLRLSAGSTVANPGYDLWPAYQQNAAVFQRAGLSVQNLWNAQRLQRNDQGDLALRWFGARGFVEGLFYYGTFAHKSVPVYDALAGLTYPQNVGVGRSYGASLSTQWQLAPRWQLAGNASYSRSVFARDLTLAGAEPLPVAGLQTPDSPLWTANLAMEYANLHWHAGLLEHYLGQRWADSLHRQPISAYFLTDAHVGYDWSQSQGRWSLELWVYNLLDRRAIGLVNTGGPTLDAGANFYPLAPRTVALSLAWHYF